MIGYHVTTPKMVRRYEATGAILPPVRFWRFENSARAWAARVKRSVILRLDLDDEACHPLPDHKPTGHAWWHDGMVRAWTTAPAPSEAPR